MSATVQYLRPAEHAAAAQASTAPFHMATRRVHPAKPRQFAVTYRQDGRHDGARITEIVTDTDACGAWLQVADRTNILPLRVEPRTDGHTEQTAPHDVTRDTALPSAAMHPARRISLPHGVALTTALVAAASAGYLIGSAAIGAITR